MINIAALEKIRSNIRTAQSCSGYDQQPVQLIAVTKTHPFSTIQEAYAAGILSIGENRIQEAVQKFESFEQMPKITRRFIGHLQTNKVKKCIELFDTIDSVDSLKLIKKISKCSLAVNKTTSVLLEVNTSGEINKHGFLPNHEDDMLRCFDEPSVKIEGLMTVGPLTTDQGKIRQAFKVLKELQNKINSVFGFNQIKELSMGMSNDYQTAIEEGSTMVRVGRALFGERNT